MSARVNQNVDATTLPSTAPAPKPVSARLRVANLLRPHWKPLALALGAVVGETLADILEPGPVKVVIDNVLGSKTLPRGWATFIFASLGHDRLAILNVALAAVIVIAG